MRTASPLLLLPVLIASILLFGWVRCERRTAPGGTAVETIEIGAPSPWLRYREQRSHADAEAFLADLEQRSEAASEAARERGAGGEPAGVSMHYRHTRTWTVDFLSWSMLAGAVALAAAILWCGLGRLRQDPAR